MTSRNYLCCMGFLLSPCILMGCAESHPANERHFSSLTFRSIDLTFRDIIARNSAVFLCAVQQSHLDESRIIALRNREFVFDQHTSCTDIVESSRKSARRVELIEYQYFDTNKKNEILENSIDSDEQVARMCANTKDYLNTLAQEMPDEDKAIMHVYLVPNNVDEANAFRLTFSGACDRSQRAFKISCIDVSQIDGKSLKAKRREAKQMTK